MRLGVDTGGTFTDFVLLDADGGLRVHKVPSTPAAPERAILQGLAELGLTAPGLALVHGSTVATNAVLEGKGARTVYVTNHGFADTLTIGRQTRQHLYDLQPPAVPPPVPAELCLETGGRFTPAGEVLEPLTDRELRELVDKVASLAPEAVAINLLFSFVDDRFEREVEAALVDHAFVSRSSEVLPEYREYERGIATWLNARVGPLMAGYLGRLAQALPGARLSVMQSSGGTVGAQQAGRRAVHLLLSGPAGGVVGAALVGKLAGVARLLSFDMGGTSTDVALIDGAPRLTGEGRVGGFPVSVPMVDIHTIGAGGGSIAWVDAGGVLQVGPQSAGADPGPACYGKGGLAPTVTDAHLVLGRLQDGVSLGGGLTLDRQAAVRAFEALADRMDMEVETVATGVLRIAEEHMTQALRVISVERGEDPRDFVLFPFGGAGGLHVCALAEKLGMTRALFPARAGVLSALGMLAAPRARDLSRTLGNLSVDDGLAILARQGIKALASEGVEESACRVQPALDMRYQGQSYTLLVPWPGNVADATEDFHVRHAARYGHRLDLPVELVNIRVRVEEAAPTIILSPPEGEVGGETLRGPMTVALPDSTLWLAEGWTATRDRFGNYALAR